MLENQTNINDNNDYVENLKRQLEKLSQELKLFKDLFNNLPFGIQVFDKEGYSLKLNQKQKEILGVKDSQEGVGKFNVLTDPFSIASGANKFYERAYQGNETHHEFKYDLAHHENHWNTRKEARFINESIYPVLNNNGVIDYVVAILTDDTEKNTTRKQLVEAENRFRKFFEDNQAVILVVDSETQNIVDVNHAAELFYGWNKKELLAKKIGELNGNQTNKIFEASRLKSLNYEIKHVLADGSEKDIEVYASCVNVADKSYIYVIIHDISKRKEYEKQLKDQTDEYWSLYEEYKTSLEELIDVKEKIEESERHFRLLVESAPEAIFIQVDSKIVYANQACLNLYGAEKSTIINSSINDRIHPDFREVVKERIKELNFNKKRVNQIAYKHIKFDGTPIDVEVSAVPYVFQEQNGALVFVRDISERLRIEREIQQKNLEFEHFFDCSLDLLCISNIEGKFIRLNKEWEFVLGYKLEELQGRNFNDFIHPDDLKSTKEIMNRLTEQHKVLNFTNRYRSKSGLYKWIEWRSVPMGEIIYAAARDVTEQILKNIELREAKEKAEESDNLKTAFLQNLSHEIRTPLNAIIGFAEMLNTKAITEEKRIKFTNIVVENSHQLLSIVSDVLSISYLETKQEKLNISQVSLNKIIDNLYDVYQPQSFQKKLDLKSFKPLTDNLAEIFGDGTKIFQILNNLLSNAFKFTPNGFIEFGYEIKDQMLEFYVKDTGIGIDPSLHDKVFERFRQAELSNSRKYGGTGLGLSISKGLAELMDGRIWLESSLGQGSIFYFSIPYFSAQKINLINPAFNKPINTMTILIVDDEESNYLLLEEFLSEFNFNILFATNGNEAIEIIKKHNDIKLVFMDIKMPVLDGYAATKIIKSFNPDLPVIAQSAYALDFEIEKYGDIFDGYITKPIKKDILIARIQEFLNKI